MTKGKRVQKVAKGDSKRVVKKSRVSAQLKHCWVSQAQEANVKESSLKKTASNGLSGCPGIGLLGADQHTVPYGP